jgi:hypothetical protein
MRVAGHSFSAKGGDPMSHGSEIEVGEVRSGDMRLI